MAQNALTVTAPNPTPPTNFGFTGATSPNPPNYTKNTYNDPKNWSATNPKDFPPPYYDDGSAGAVTTFAANVAALASGTGATAGGTEGTYPGAGTSGNFLGAVPASSSVAHEGAGTELSVTAPGSRTECPTLAVSAGPVVNTQALRDAGPNANHASTLSGTAVPTLSAASGASNVSGAGTTLLTVTGTNYNRASFITLNGIPMQTNYVSATSLTVTNAPKRATAGTLPVTVTSNGVTTAPVNWTLT